MEILKQHKSSRVNVLDLIYFIHSISLNSTFEHIHWKLQTSMDFQAVCFHFSALKTKQL